MWLDRYTQQGLAGLSDRPRGAGREQVPAVVRARVLALSKQSPPAETGLSRRLFLCLLGSVHAPVKQGDSCHSSGSNHRKRRRYRHKSPQATEATHISCAGFVIDDSGRHKQ